MTDYVVLDLETTGLSPIRDSILEIGAWEVKSGVVVGHYQSFIHQDYIVPVVSKLTGITLDMVSDARGLNDVLRDFYTWCGDACFLGHNLMNFDYRFLCRKGEECGIDFTLGGGVMWEGGLCW